MLPKKEKSLPNLLNLNDHGNLALMVIYLCLWRECVMSEKGLLYCRYVFFFLEFLHLHMTSIMDPMISHVFQAHLWNFCVPSSFDVERPFCSPIHCSFFLPFAGSFSFVWAWSHNEEEFYLIFCLFLNWGPLLG